MYLREPVVHSINPRLAVGYLIWASSRRQELPRRVAASRRLIDVCRLRKLVCEVIARNATRPGKRGWVPGPDM